MLIGDLFTGIVEGVGALAELFCESLSFASGYLGAKPKDGEVRLSARRVCIALAPLALLVSAIVGICGWCWWRSHARTSTQQTVVACANSLAGDRLDNGRFRRIQGNALPEKDWWGHPLQVQYAEHPVADVLVVRSVGPDGMAETGDDIVTSRQVILPKELAGAATKRIGRFVLERLHKSFNGKP